MTRCPDPANRFPRQSFPRRSQFLFPALFLAFCLTFFPKPAPVAAQQIIDDFAGTTQQVSATGAGNSDSDSAADATVLGSERDVEINVTGGGGALTVDIDSAGDPGVYTHAQGSGVFGTSLVSWDGADGDPLTVDFTGLGGVDVTEGGRVDALLLGVASDDLPIDIVFTMYTDGANFSNITLNLPGLIGIGPNPPATFIVPFSDMAVAAGTGADFTNIGAITMLVDGSSGFSDVDLRLDLVSTEAILNATKVDAVVIDNDGDGLADPGDTIRYTVVISNPDDDFDAAATGVTYASGVDLNTTLVVGSVTTSQGTVTTGNTGGDTSVAVDIGTIADAASVTLTYDVLIDNPVPAGLTEILCQGFVSSDGITDLPTDDPDDPTGDDDPTVTPLDAAPLITVLKADTVLVDGDGDGIPGPGETIGYTVLITNTGSAAATAVVFSSGVDPNTSLVVGSVTTTQGSVVSGNGAGDTAVTVSVATIPPDGGSVTVTFSVTVNDPLPLGVTEVACQGTVNGGNFPDTPTDDPDDPAPDDPTVTPLDLEPQIVATKEVTHLQDNDGDGLVSAGDLLGYIVVITNIGLAPATGVLFTDTPDPNTTLENGTVTTTQGTVTSGNGAGDSSVAIDLGTVAAGGASVTITYEVLIDDPLPEGVTILSNQGLVTGNDLPDTPSDDPTSGEPDDPTEVDIDTPPIVVEVPTLGDKGVWLLIAALAGVALARLRRDWISG